MNPNYGKHPADQKASEVITMIPNYFRVMNNNSNYDPSQTSSDASRRSSVNFDICYELDLRNMRKGQSNPIAPVERPEKCPHCNLSLIDKPPIYSKSVNIESLGCEKELHFIRAIIWLKSAIKMMKDVSANDIYEIFGGLSGIHHPENSLISSSCIRDSNVIMHNPRMTKMSQLQESYIQGKQYLIPEDEVPQSQMSNMISFDEDFDNEHITNNVLPIDSGIVMLHSISNASKFDVSKLEYGKESNSSVLNAEKPLRHPEDGQVKKKLKTSVEMISSASLSNLIENLRLNNFVLGEIRIILGLLESDVTAKNYIKNGVMIREAIDIIVQFLNQLATDNDMSSSGVYLQLCTENIVAAIRKIFNSKTYINLNAAARQFQLMTIIGFCNCLKICEETIDLIINSLTEIVDTDMDESEEPLMINDGESHLLCRILQMAVYKYREIVGPSRKMKEKSHHYTTFIWRSLWKNHKQYELPDFRAREIEVEWVSKLEKLISPEFPMGLSIFGDYKAIKTAITILSELSSTQT